MDQSQPTQEKNWWESPWFGTFYAPDNRGWLMHADLGWLFAYGQPEQAVWLWRKDLAGCGRIPITTHS